MTTAITELSFEDRKVLRHAARERLYQASQLQSDPGESEYDFQHRRTDLMMLRAAEVAKYAL